MEILKELGIIPARDTRRNLGVVPGRNTVGNIFNNSLQNCMKFLYPVSITG